MADGKVQLEIRYCVPWGYWFQAAGLASQIVAGRNREVGVTLTPAGRGTFEVYLDGDLVYNRKEIPQTDLLKDPVGDVRNGVSVAEMLRTKLMTALDAASTEPAAAAH